MIAKMGASKFLLLYIEFTQGFKLFMRVLRNSCFFINIFCIVLKSKKTYNIISISEKLYISHYSRLEGITMDEKRESFKKAFEEVFYEGRIGMRRCCGRNACQKLIDMANRMDPNKPEGYYGDSRETGMINEMQARHLKELLKTC